MQCAGGSLQAWRASAGKSVPPCWGRGPPPWFRGGGGSLHCFQGGGPRCGLGAAVVEGFRKGCPAGVNSGDSSMLQGVDLRPPSGGPEVGPLPGGGTKAFRMACVERFRAIVRNKGNGGSVPPQSPAVTG